MFGDSGKGENVTEFLEAELFFYELFCSKETITAVHVGIAVQSSNVYLCSFQ